MKPRNAALVAAWLLIAPMCLLAQPSLKGRVQVANEPASGATVMLTALQPSANSRSLTTAKDGVFVFESTVQGWHSLVITHSGYNTYRLDSLEINSATDLGLITLDPASKTLGDVSVSSRKPLVTRKNDRTIVNVDAMISAAGGTALDVLEKSPGLQVSQDGSISMKGKQGVTVFIDDKPTYLSGDQLANYLRSIPASELEQVELMPNPPARYDAAGNGGVINIRTKKVRQKGWNGGLNAGVTQGHRTRSNSSANINFRRNKFTFFVSVANSYNNSFTDLDLYRRYLNNDKSTKSFFEQNSFFNREGNTASFRTGADFYQNEKSTWGVSFNGMDRASTQQNDNISNLLNPQRQPDSSIISDNHDRIRFRNFGMNANFRHQFNKTGHGITADADFIRYTNRTWQRYRNLISNADGSPRYNELLEGNLPNHIDIYSIKTDYTRPLANGMRFEAGLKNSYASTDNIAAYDLTTGGTKRPDYEKSNHFIYKENIAAIYTNFSLEKGPVSLQAGLRAEHTNSDGRQLGNAAKADSSFNRQYTSLFPTFYVTYKMDSLANNQIGLNYGRRIDRPYYQDLNPFLSPMDKFTYYSGNPFLRPAFTHKIELSHTWHNRITTTLSYSHTHDDVAETIEISNGVYYSRPGNIGKSTGKSLSVDANFDPYKWLNIHVYTEVTELHSKSAFYTGQLNTRGTYWYFGPVSRLTFGKGWTGELSGSYITRLTTAQFIMKSIWGASAAVQKKFSQKITMKLAVNDLFYTRVNRGIITSLALTEASWRNRQDSRAATLTFSYNFGKAFAQKKYEASGADSEKNRVRN